MKKLRVNILRGKDKIGENLIEVSDGKTKILLECGVALEPTKQSVEIENKVIITEYDAVIITHYHGDHSALLKKPLKARKIYLSNGALKILEYCNGVCEENKQKIETFSHGKTIKIGNIMCKPCLCDHSAYDSYMIEIIKDGENILYTGDFRSNGRKNFQALLERLPNKVDLLISEATSPTNKNETEKELEEKAVEIFSKHNRVFILQSTLNIDRTVSFYRASKRTGKPFIMGVSSAGVCLGLKNIPNPLTFSDCYVYFNKSVDSDKYGTIKNAYKNKLIGRTQIEKMEKFTMQVNSNMLCYFQKLKGVKDSVLIYSMWQGYKEEMKEFLDGVQNLGVKVIDLHVSGHADLPAIEKLIKRTNPKKIELVHKNSNLFTI